MVIDVSPPGGHAQASPPRPVPAENLSSFGTNKHPLSPLLLPSVSPPGLSHQTSASSVRPRSPPYSSQLHGEPPRPDPLACFLRPPGPAGYGPTMPQQYMLKHNCRRMQIVYEPLLDADGQTSSELAEDGLGFENPFWIGVGAPPPIHQHARRNLSEPSLKNLAGDLRPEGGEEKYKRKSTSDAILKNNKPPVLDSIGEVPLLNKDNISKPFSDMFISEEEPMPASANSYIVDIPTLVEPGVPEAVSMRAIDYGAFTHSKTRTKQVLSLLPPSERKPIVQVRLCAGCSKEMDSSMIRWGCTCGSQVCALCQKILATHPDDGGVWGNLEALKCRMKGEPEPPIKAPPKSKIGTSVGADWVLRNAQQMNRNAGFEPRWGCPRF